MIQHTVARLAWTVWGLTVASVVGFVVFGALAHTMAASEYTIFPVVVMGFATVGTLIVARRGGNTIGWVFSWFALAGSFGYLAGNYAAYGIDAAPGSVPAATLAAWIGRSAFAATLLPLPLMFLLFPDGRVPTRRWRPVLWIILAAAGVTWVGFSFSPGPINAGFTELAAPVDNPLGLPGGWKPAVEAVTTTTGFVVLAGGLASVLALLLRFRRSRGEERQQIRWLVYVGATAVGALILDILGETARPLLGIEVSHDDLFSTVTFFVFILTLLLGIPAACAIAILRYRLYDLDVVIKKTVVYGVLAAFMTLVYVLVALLIPLALVGSGDPLSGPLPIVAALIIAVTFQPVRSRARKLANRIVYGERATPYEVLSDFSERVAGAYSTDDVLPRMAQIMAAGTGATRARVWLRVANELRPAASWPAGDGGMRERLTLSGDDLPKFPGANHAFAVRHQGELLGALTVAVPASDPLTPSQEKLLQDLAAQAGLVLRNVRLIEELRASRQRLVAAQDEERRKIERNLHDGAQQQLVALSVKLRLALTEAEREEAPKTREVLGQLQAETSGVLETLRDLARGIYPPLLADKGLAAALEAQARKSPVPVEVDRDSVGRYPQEVEAAVYFCCLEALVNVVKYAEATQATLRLADRLGELRFEVTDDGCGFDPASTGYGTGLQGMADRLDAIGGSLEVRSAPGAGTTVTGTVPVQERTR